VKQGDEVFPREDFQRVYDATQGDDIPVHPEQIIEMYEAVHKFVIVDRKLRPQYLTIILHMLTSYLTRQHQTLAHEFADKLAVAAANN
jgi:hypothetical protein